MIPLDEALAELKEHPGVQHLLVLGRDGLLIRHVGDPFSLQADTVAAMIPGLISAATSLGRAAETGSLVTSVVEYSGGVVIVVALSSEVFLAVLVRPGVGFAPLLRALRSGRERFAGLF